MTVRRTLVRFSCLGIVGVIATLVLGGVVVTRRVARTVDESRVLHESIANAFAAETLRLRIDTEILRPTSEVDSASARIDGTLRRRERVTDYAFEVVQREVGRSEEREIVSDVVSVDGVRYVRVRSLPGGADDALLGVWLRLPSGPADADSAREDLQRALRAKNLFRDVERVGHERLDGERMTRFHAVVAPEGGAELLARLSSASGETSADVLAALARGIGALGIVPVDAWVDATGNIRMLRLELQPPGQPTTRTTLTVGGYGGPVDIRAPEGARELPVRPPPAEAGASGGGEE